jgi:hypothetical protein
VHDAYAYCIAHLAYKQAPAADVICDYQGQMILFTNDAMLVSKSMNRVKYCGSTEQEVLCIDDERQVRVRSNSMLDSPDHFAEGMRANIQARPPTAVTVVSTTRK